MATFCRDMRCRTVASMVHLSFITSLYIWNWIWTFQNSCSLSYYHNKCKVSHRQCGCWVIWFSMRFICIYEETFSLLLCLALHSSSQSSFPSSSIQISYLCEVYLHYKSIPFYPPVTTLRTTHIVPTGYLYISE